jgi:hypothetical protein
VPVNAGTHVPTPLPVENIGDTTFSLVLNELRYQPQVKRFTCHPFECTNKCDPSECIEGGRIFPLTINPEPVIQLAEYFKYVVHTELLP